MLDNHAIGERSLSRSLEIVFASRPESFTNGRGRQQPADPTEPEETTNNTLKQMFQTRVRSSLGTLMQFFLVAGFLIEYVVGPYTSYLTLAIVSLATPVLCVGMFMWMPDSPHSLLVIRSGGEQKAMESLRWLRGNPQETVLIKELSEIKVSAANISSTAVLWRPSIRPSGADVLQPNRTTKPPLSSFVLDSISPDHSLIPPGQHIHTSVPGLVFIANSPA